MLAFHDVLIEKELDRDNPLYVGNYFNLKGMWWTKRKQRQRLIVSIAFGWYQLFKRQEKMPALIEEEMLITSLTKHVKEARQVIEKFFIIKRIGFNFGDGIKHSPTIVSPRKLPKRYVDSVEAIRSSVKFSPGPVPQNSRLTKSLVHVRKHRWPFIRSKLLNLDREDLIVPAKWLCDQNQPLTFYFYPMGKLQARDTSMWPIKNIELWPGWLRKELFGTVVDIENAYCQFLTQHLYAKYKDNMKRLELKYPDILRAVRDKKNFREELCTQVLKLPVSDESIGAVKKLIMSLANGSNASPALMTNGAGRSDAVRIVLQANPHLTLVEMVEAGKRLSFIAKQFRAAKKDICLFVLKDKPSAANVKKVFKLYFEWEREQRYKIWKMVGFTGVNAHDGIDGIIINNPKQFEQSVFERFGLKVKVDNYENDPTLRSISNKSKFDEEATEYLSSVREEFCV